MKVLRLIGLFGLIALTAGCQQARVPDTVGGDNQVPPATKVSVAGRWVASFTSDNGGGSSSGRLDLTMSQTGTTFYGNLEFTAVSARGASVTGDAATGAFTIRDGGAYTVDVTGKFSESSYSGRYRAHSPDGQEALGSVTMQRADTADLTVAFSGPPTAVITVANASGTFFSGALSKTSRIQFLPKGIYTVTAQDSGLYAAPPAQTVDLTNGDASITLNYTLRDFTVSAPIEIEVNADGTSALLATVSPQSSFSGAVTLTFENLPAGVSQVAPAVVKVDGNPVSLNLEIAASADVVIQDVTATLKASSGNSTASYRFNLKLRPKKITVAGLGSNGFALGADGFPYVNSYSLNGVFRIKPDGSTERITTGTTSCGGLIAAQDGSLWTNEVGFTRIDPIAKTVERLPNPLGMSGCGSFNPDKDKRIWYWYFGLYRADLANNKADKVPESDSYYTAKPYGDAIWVASGTRLIKIDSLTLAKTTYNVPVNYTIGTFIVRGDKVLLESNGIYLYDLASGTATLHSIPGLTSSPTLVGQDANGIIWARDYSKWVRYDPTSKQVLRTLPALSSHYSVHVAPDGALWYLGGAATIHYLKP